MIRGKTLLLCALAALLAISGTVIISLHTLVTSASPNSQEQSGVLKNITYCKGGDVDLKMDLYSPSLAPGKTAPTILYVHGGSWRAGDKSEALVLAVGAVSQGYIVASINYRLAPKYHWPAQIEDTKCAVRFLKANAAKYNIDPARIAIWGSSAGGHLAALAGLAGPSAGLEGKGGWPDQSSSVVAVIDMFGPTDFTVPINSAGPNIDVPAIESLLGRPLSQAGDLLKEASPVTYVRKDAPPFLILHGDKDSVVPFSQSQILYDDLKAVGADATLITVKNADHGFIPTGGPMSPSLDQLVQIVFNFLEKNVRNANQPALTFPQTGKTVKGRFLDYWQTHGGVAQQGYPISDVMQETSDVDGKTYMVQYFERAVFEAHPENKAPYDVLLSLLGRFRYKEKYVLFQPDQQPNNSPGSVYFAQTGHWLGGKFLQYWQTHGGVAQQGYPISDEFQEKSDLDGKTYTVQYFERAVFEYHPENKAPYDVLLSQLGRFRYTEKYAMRGQK